MVLAAARLSTQGVEVGQALSPIGQRHHQLGQAHARVMTAPRHVSQHQAEPSGQAAAIGHLAQPHQPATRHQALAIAVPVRGRTSLVAFPTESPPELGC